MDRLKPILILACLPLTVPAAAAEIDFRSQVLPLLSENCFNCHGPDSGTREAGLRLDLRDAALTPSDSGVPAIVPGDPSASNLIARITTDDPGDVMPPPSSKKILTPEAIEILRRWIAEGAEYQNHWAFDPVVRPQPPRVQAADWPKNPIDHFILARLESENLRPSPGATKSTLLRRLSLDLTGLPPKPEELTAFTQDSAPDAYERAVERLLASPHYGERMAIPWLDAARYADSNGFQQDGDTYQYVWRDWVVRALNANMPFDQFAIEQLAGDLLPEPTVDQLVATGFNRNHLHNGEGGAIAEEQRHVILFDRVDVTSTTFLGLTMACAQCHDHKYDPLPQSDYYRMMAFFNKVPESGRPPGGGQYRIADPWIHAGSPEEMAELARLEEAARQASIIPDEVLAAQAAWENSFSGATPPEWKALRPTTATATDEVVLEITAESTVFATGARPPKANYTLALPASEDAPVSGIRLDTIPDSRLPSAGAGRSDSGNAVLTRVRVHSAGAEIPLAAATADYSQAGFSAEGVLDDAKGKAWAFHPDVTTPHHLVIQFSEPIPPGQPITLKLEFQSDHSQHQLGHFRLSTTATPQPISRLEPTLLAALAKPVTERTPAERDLILDHFLKSSPDPSVAEIRRAKNESAAALSSFRDALPKVMIMSDSQPRKTHILGRGHYESPLDEVTPGTPKMLPPMPADAPTNRLGFARWLFAPENPLTARVQVNRYWQHFFGTGIVKSSENLGVQADPPTHPELLDWLAAEFRDSGWDVKHLHRLIVTSATYRQSAKVGPELLEKDPENKLLARAHRHRLPAMILRDLALASGDLIDLRAGGKPVYPYQPTGIWDGLAITKERDFTYPQSTGKDLHRRSLYTFWRRTVAPGNMFDASSRTICSVKPSLTNTPIHALTTLNDTTWVEAARALATTAIRETSEAEPAAQLAQAFLRACSRQPDADELKILTRSFENALREFSDNPAAAAAFLAHGEASSPPAADSAHLAALAAVCLSILNLDEALTRG
jgi:mono/diheme cytochrome c family protein